MYPYLSRVLSVEAFGLFGFSMTFVVLFQVIVEYGFMISATGRIASSPDDPQFVGRVISTTMLAKSLLVIVSVIAFTCTAVSVDMVRAHLLVVGLFFLNSITGALLPDFYFRGVEQMRSIALRALVSRAASVAVIFVVVHGDNELALVPAALLLGNLLSVALGFIAILRAGIALPTPRFGDALISLREGVGFFASRVAASVNQSAGSIVLGLRFAPNSSAVAQFTGAVRISSAAELAVIPVSDAIYPRMVRSRDYILFKKVYFAGIGLWLLCCGVVFLWAKEICVIILGAPYAPAGDLLRVLVVGTFFAYSSNLLGYPALAPIGLANQANIALLVSSVITVMVYLILWRVDSISARSVCVVVALTNIVVFLYRVGFFLTFRARWLPYSRRS